MAGTGKFTLEKTSGKFLMIPHWYEWPNPETVTHNGGPFLLDWLWWSDWWCEQGTTELLANAYNHVHTATELSLDHYASEVCDGPSFDTDRIMCRCELISPDDRVIQLSGYVRGDNNWRNAEEVDIGGAVYWWDEDTSSWRKIDEYTWGVHVPEQPFPKVACRMDEDDVLGPAMEIQAGIIYRFLVQIDNPDFGWPQAPDWEGGDDGTGFHKLTIDWDV